jgi:hypothetical protein
MRDDTARWAAPDVSHGRNLAGDGLQIRRVRLESQTLISGPRNRAMQEAGLQSTAAWPDVVPDDRYALSLRRDRILCVNTGPSDTGWLEDRGLAVSDMTSGYEVVEITGQDALDFLKTGTELSLNEVSASALRLWHGFGVILYRFQQPDRYRLHVAMGFGEGLWDTMASQLAVFEP